MDKVPMTAAGHAAMMDEIKHLKAVERPRIIRAIEEARSHGDLSENAEYHAAKEQQGWTEARVAELEDKISRAEVIDISKLSGDTVKFGAKVTLVDADTEDKAVYQIVGEFEADVKKGMISVTSPIARAIIGKRTGDSVEVSTPGGGKSYEIVKVRYNCTPGDLTKDEAGFTRPSCFMFRRARRSHDHDHRLSCPCLL
jgi:transcription elongation factor GreA